MITLYHSPYSCSLAVKAALVAVGEEFETQTISLSEGEHLKDEYLQINPMGKVPALKINGEVLTEGAAINQFLAERYPEAKLMPENGTLKKANALKWLHFLYSSFHAAFSRAFFPERFGKETSSIKQLAEEDVHKYLKIIDQELAKNEFIAGDHLSLADLYLMAAIHWEKVLAKPIMANYKNIARFEQSIFSLPKIGQVYKEEYQ